MVCFLIVLKNFFWVLDSSPLTDIGFANILLQSVAFHSSSSASEVFVLNQGIKVMVCDFLHLLQIFVGDKVWH